MSIQRCGAAALLLLCLSPAGWAYNGHKTTLGPVGLEIGEVATIAEYGKPAPVAVTVRNSGDQPLAVELEMTGLVDQWRAVGETTRKLELPAKGEQAVTFQIAAGEGAYSAHYPVHVTARFEWEGKRQTLHAVQIFEPQFQRREVSSAEPTPMEVLSVPAKGALSLFATDRQRVAWRYYDGPLVYKRQGWQGSDPKSRASFVRRGGVVRGMSRNAIVMHPPWVPGGGTIFADYLVELPKQSRPLKLTFANAIRDSSAAEPVSDGVTFRVWAGDEKLFERHTDSKTWVEGEADLRKHAGQRILLRLESHPGPAKSTTCDSSYWAEPTIVAGPHTRLLSLPERKSLHAAARAALARGSSKGGEIVWRLGDGPDACLAAIVPSPNGMLDGAIAVGQGDRCVVFDGLRLTIDGRAVHHVFPTCALSAGGFRDGGNGYARFEYGDPTGSGDHLHITFRARGGGLRIEAKAKPRITDIALGPADQAAPRVYYGHGYVIEQPKPFRAGFGGHNLSTSHVGFDFEQGVSLVQAVDSPPDYLEVSPEARIYALHSHMDTTLTLVPSLKGALDAAVRYQPLYDKKPAGGFRRKAGRFVFDIWGGRYADIADTMQQMIDYGCTDSLLTVHVWQRWGYDYRLPDIWPPSPYLGTVDDMRKIAAVCKEHDIPWGLHDNYIDFYPDAADYTYRRICFTRSGQPIKAWLNEGRDARSYRWRPDCILPFVQRNLRLIRPAVAPTHYFIDVFTSARTFDYYDLDGTFHPSTETRRCWGEAFAWIRDTLGGNAPTTSEAGHDQLIGYLDGADCQHLQLSDGHQRFHIHLPCKDWERVLWFDAVNHTRFSLHGVGYSNRYQGFRPRRLHGIVSDDYITAELLMGHALMMDRGGFGREAVRKYWLAQDLIRSLALDTIESVELVGGDIHRQVVTWRSGAKVWVNRGAEDWPVAGKVLPQYGCLAKSGGIETSIERIGGVIVEQSKAPGRWYVNARTHAPGRPLAIRPEAGKLEHLGGRDFKLAIDWHADEPAPRDLQAFVHFDYHPKGMRGDAIAFQGDHGLVPSSRWKGTVTTSTPTVTIPDEHGPGRYKATVGLYHPGPGGRRFPLTGDDDGSGRIRLGVLVVEGKGDQIAGIRLEKHEPPPIPKPRTNRGGKPIDFGPAVTTGAFRLLREGDKLVVIPLPDEPAFTVTLHLDRLGLGGRKPASVSAVARDGRRLREVPWQPTDRGLSLKTQPGEFKYVIRF